LAFAIGVITAMSLLQQLQWSVYCVKSTRIELQQRDVLVSTYRLAELEWRQ